MVTRPDLPAIFLSGRVQEADVTAEHSLGAVDLSKPFVGSALLSALERLLTSHQAPVAEW